MWTDTSTVLKAEFSGQQHRHHLLEADSWRTPISASCQPTPRPSEAGTLGSGICVLENPPGGCHAGSSVRTRVMLWPEAGNEPS